MQFGSIIDSISVIEISKICELNEVLSLAMKPSGCGVTSVDPNYARRLKRRQQDFGDTSI